MKYIIGYKDSVTQKKGRLSEVVASLCNVQVLEESQFDGSIVVSATRSQIELLKLRLQESCEIEEHQMGHVF